MYGKTGTSVTNGTLGLCWYVGFLEAGDTTTYFAMNVEGEKMWLEWTKDKRHEATLEALRELEVIPSTP